MIKYPGLQKVRKPPNKERVDPLKVCVNPGTRRKPYKLLCYLVAFPILIRYPTIPYFDTLPNNTLIEYNSDLYHILTHCQFLPLLSTLPSALGNQSNSSKKNRKVCEPITTECYVGSQSESSITSPESSLLGLKYLVGSRLESALNGLS